MKRFLTIAFCLLTISSSNSAYSQPANSQASQFDGPVAFLYVGNSQINAFSVSSEGRLAPVHGSPFAGAPYSMAVNGKYLFAENPYLPEIDSFAIAQDGSLSHAAVATTIHLGCDDSQISNLFLDHTGATLYGLNYDGAGASCDSAIYGSYRVQKPTGDLAYLGSNGASPHFNSPLTFVSNNRFAYGAFCQGSPGARIYAFERTTSSELHYINVTAPLPSLGDEKRDGRFYCPSLTAADPTNHMAVYVQGYDQNGSEYQPQLASYTVDSAGNLMTTSTAQNMPEAPYGAQNLRMSPSGKLLAVAGYGLQLFHFNGGGSITPYAQLTGDDIEQVFWDNDNHLFAISQIAGKIFVYTVTPTSITQAPGSPYDIDFPVSMIVQPVTPNPYKH